jgi:hypothetical protein
MRPAVHRPLLLALNLVAILGCGSSKGTTTADAGSTGGTSAAGAGGVGVGGAQAGANGTGAANSTGGVAGVGGAGTGAGGAGGNTGGSGTGVAGVGGTIVCGQTSVPLQPLAPDILILLDNSTSMNDDISGRSCSGGCGSRSKWSQVLTGIEEVVMTTQATVNWGLKFMDADSFCGVAPGVAVDVGVGGYTAISDALAAAQPLGYTPTELAIDSAVAYLQSRTDPNSKYILLATDGLPNCTPGGANLMADDSPGAEAALKAASTAGFNTFVVGIATNDPTSTAILNTMAVAGGEPQPAGSDSLFYLAADTATLEESLTTIAANATPCAFTLPAAPAGSTLAISAATSGGSVTIAKDATNGWASATDMKSIALKGTACASAQSGSYTNIVASYLCAP